MVGYLQIKQLVNQAMWHLGINFRSLFFLLLLITGCNSNTEEEFKKSSFNIIEQKGYWSIYNRISDTLKSWNIHNIGYFSSQFKQTFKIDSLLCFNSKGDRLRGSIHVYCNENNPSDNLYFLQGEKINNKWYFFTTATVVLPRKWYQKTETLPLSYSKMHKLSIKEILSGYLKPNGDINEAFFTHEFEGPGWLNYPETLDDLKKLTRKDFEQRHLQYVKNNWNGIKKDSLKILN